MRKVVIMRALPGAGKSTYVKEQIIPNYRKVDVCSADDYFMVDGEYRFDPTKISLAHKECFQRFLGLVASGSEVVVVDNTNINTWEISPYVLAAEAFDYEVTVVRVVAKPQDCVERNKHGVSALVIGQMVEAMRRESLPPWWNCVEIKSVD